MTIAEKRKEYTVLLKNKKFYDVVNGNCQGSCQQKLKFFIHSGCPILLCT